MHLVSVRENDFRVGVDGVIQVALLVVPFTCSPPGNL